MNLPELIVDRLPILLHPDPARVVLRPFIPADADSAPGGGRSRAQRLADRVLALPAPALEDELARVIASLTDRHPDPAAVLQRRFQEVVCGLAIGASATGEPAMTAPATAPAVGEPTMIEAQATTGPQCAIGDLPMSAAQKLLIGAYFSEEYSFEAAALFNPSMVVHPVQNGPPGTLRFILALRGVGEGHVSSITFRTGLIGTDGTITIDPVSAQAISPAIEIIAGGDPDDPGMRLSCTGSRDLSEIVIFPITLRQRHGVEDLRLVRFVEADGAVSWLGTYTAFSGEAIRAELLRTTDFSTFELLPLRGAAAATKGLALFPRRIGGQFAMLGRLDHENIALLRSDDLLQWDDGTAILFPQQPWEFIQLGNCGSPIEIDEGWVLLFHGVGPVRNYSLGACLLDKTNPTKVLRRLAEPLLQPSAMERNGYVPNVLYSCGGLVNGRKLILPYAVADSYTTFATVELDDLLAAMT